MREFNADQLNKVWQDILIEPITMDIIISAISTDSRCLCTGETFVALSGDNFDGHHFVKEAMKRGTNAIVVENRQNNLQLPQIIVSNTRLALAKLAMVIRNNFAGKVIALTGSVGKTTNKQMLSSVFSTIGKTHATKGNLNNDLGVPFTWFDLPDDAQYAIIEMGANHEGEIDYLTGISQPDIGLITNAGEVHLQGFINLDGVAKGKGELFSHLQSGNSAIINKDDKYQEYWQTLLAPGVHLYTFSLHDHRADVYSKDISANGSLFTLCYKNHRQDIRLPTVGIHNVINALGVAACAIAAKVPLDKIAEGLANFTVAPRRLQKYQLAEITLIDDTYNANPLSMQASAEILKNSEGYRIMVLGDMEELGENEIAMHAKLGENLQKKADVFFCVGNKMRAFVNNNMSAKHFNNLDLLCPVLFKTLSQHAIATVLVKGSRSMQMERVVSYLLNKLK